MHQPPDAGDRRGEHILRQGVGELTDQLHFAGGDEGVDQCVGVGTHDGLKGRRRARLEEGFQHRAQGALRRWVDFGGRKIGHALGAIDHEAIGRGKRAPILGALCDVFIVVHDPIRALVEIISSTPRVFVSGCGKARLAGNSGAIAKRCNAAAAAHEQPNVEIILTRVLSLRVLTSGCLVVCAGRVLRDKTNAQRCRRHWHGVLDTFPLQLSLPVPTDSRRSP